MQSAIVQESAEALFTIVAATGAAAVRARGYWLLDLCEQETGLGKGGGVGPMVGEELAPLLDLAFCLAGSLRHGSHDVYEVLSQQSLDRGVAVEATAQLFGEAVVHWLQDGARVVEDTSVCEGKSSRAVVGINHAVVGIILTLILAFLSTLYPIDNANDIFIVNLAGHVWDGTFSIWEQCQCCGW